MTNLNVNILWGPGAIPGNINTGTAWSTLSLNDSDNSVAYILSIPKNGSITEVGFYMAGMGGTPPQYNIGLVTLDSNGDPTTTPYGGSAITLFTPPGSAGFVWVALDTPSSGSAGDLVAIRVYPGGTPPDGTNYIQVPSSSNFASTLPRRSYYSTSWAKALFCHPHGIRYSDNSVYGNPIKQVASLTSSVERGGKFTLPFKALCVGLASFMSSSSANQSFTFRIRDVDDNIIAEVTISDEDLIGGGDGQAPNRIYFPSSVWLEAETIYRATEVSGSGNFVTSWFRFHNASEKGDFIPEASRWEFNYLSSGEWIDNNPDMAVPRMALLLSQIDQPTSGSGGGGAYGYVG